MKTIRLKLKDVLGRAKADEIGLALAAAREDGRTCFSGAWCSETRMGLVIEIRAGKPTKWHLSGPMDRQDAAVWLGGIEAALTPAPSTTAH